MNIIADTHTHTIMSGHAYSTLLENVRAAKEKGLQFLAVTDHAGLMPGGPDDVYFICMKSSVPDEYEGVEILRGSEVNILDESGRVDLPDWIMDRLDWNIASIHSVITKPMGKKAHTKLWCNIAKNPHIQVIGHCGEEQYRFDYEEGVRAFAEYGKIVEINASSFRTRPNCTENCMEIAELCVKHGVPLVVSSDAHFVSDVGNVGQAVELLKQRGIPKTAVLNADREHFAAKIREIKGRK